MGRCWPALHLGSPAGMRMAAESSGGHPGEPVIGACWNWHNGYRDPIANDPNVVDDTLSRRRCRVRSIRSGLRAFLHSLFY
jgi:hypothetical protein